MALRRHSIKWSTNITGRIEGVVDLLQRFSVYIDRRKKQIHANKTNKKNENNVDRSAKLWRKNRSYCGISQ